MPTVKLGQTNKRVNSTSKAFAGSASSFNCTLREKCGLYNPVFILESQTFGNKYNYAEFEGLYYWIDDIISFPRNIIEVHCHLDPLASYQDDIFNTYAFCLYADSGHWNKDVDDIRMQPEKIDRTNSATENLFPFEMSANGGTVIVSVFECAMNDNNHQGVATYGMTIGDFHKMLESLYTVLNNLVPSPNQITSSINSALGGFSSTDDVANYTAASFTTICHDLEKGLADIIGRVGGVGGWRENLLSARYVPIPLSAFSGDGNITLHLGAIPCGKYKRIYPSEIKTKNGSLTLTWCTKNSANTRFLCYPRFQQFQVSCMGGQYAAIDSLRLKDHIGSGSNDIAFYSAIDICSGDWSAVINESLNTDAEKLASFSGNCSVDITGLVGRGGMGSYINTVSGGFKIAGDIMSMGMASRSFDNGFTSIANSAMDVGTGITQRYINNGASGASSGVAGTGISCNFLQGVSAVGKIDLSATAFYPAMLDNTSGYVDYCHKYGYPCNQYLNLYNVAHGAFVQCSGASVATTAPQQALAFINQTLNSGCYLED